MTLGWRSDDGLFYYVDGDQAHIVAAEAEIELDPQPQPMTAWDWLMDQSVAIRDDDVVSHAVVSVRQLTYQPAEDRWGVGKARYPAAAADLVRGWVSFDDPKAPAVTDAEVSAFASFLASAVKNKHVTAFLVGERVLFYHPQDICRWAADWVTDRRAREAARTRVDERKKDELRRQQEQAYWEATRKDGFVNPYNFVPIPDGRLVEGQRQRPAGHDRQYAHLHTGILRFSAIAVTPLALADSTEPGENGEPTILPRRLEDGRIDVWGSGLKGSLRSAYEALTGSCLRVLTDSLQDTVYRDPAKVRDGDWRVGIVTGVDADGLPTQVEVCPDFVWVPVTDLSRRGLQTGDRFDLVGGTRRTVAGRPVLEGASAVRAMSPHTPAWVVLVTDLAARGNPATQTWYWVMGREGGPPTPVSDKARKRFKIEVGGTRASTKRNSGAAVGPTTPVGRRKQGEFRTPLLESLTPGTPVWCEIVGSTVSRLAPSYLWRTWREGIASVLDRLKSTGHDASLGNEACRDPEHLCPACRAFGSVDVRSAEQARTGRSEQDSYRGQIRPIALRSDVPVDLGEEPEQLAVMGEARPGSGQNYFRLSTARTNASQRGDRPLRELGGSADRRARPNGTKRWWMTSGLSSGRQRWTRLTATGDGQGNMNRSARLVPAATTFSGSLAFVNLTSMELGALIAALDPGRLPDAVRDGHGWHLGGGKPIGLGVMRTTGITIETWSAAQRYLGQDGERTAWAAEQIDEAIAALVGDTPDEIRDGSWPAFRNLTQIDRVPGDVVTYPMKWGREFTRPTNPTHYLKGEANPGYSTATAGTSVSAQSLVLLPTATDPAIAQHLNGSGSIERAE